MSKRSKIDGDNKDVEAKYKKIDHHKHALRRPGMYIGSVKEEKTVMWVYNDENKGDESPKIISKEINYVPGLYKIYDEILVNARDHVVTCIEENLEKCTAIKVDIDQETGKISVWNNGEGIPVLVHSKYKMLIPSMIFGELLSSSNYNDKKKRKVGGTNGLGAKLTNIYSKEFEVETLDVERNKKFYQRFADNMYTKEEPKISSGKNKKSSYTKISFIPDFEKFGIDGLNDDIISLFKKRVYDIAMSVSLISSTKVYYNGELIPINNFTKYIDLYFPGESNHKKVIDIGDENWKVCVIYDPTDTLEHQSISFVNGICTSRGGTHVDHVANQIVNKLKECIYKKNKQLTIKPNMIKENLIFFVDSVIVNPDFDTQTKELLKTKAADFGSKYVAPESFLKKIAKTGVVEQIVANAQARVEASLITGKKSGNHSSPDKLYPALKAGTAEGYKCTIILTEGDSAKSFAMSGFGVTGRNYYGAFPLKGKLLNVRDSSPIQIANNEEIKAIMNIVGLEFKKVYQDVKGLRYGRIMILADQDVDGYHIKGLIMNFIHYFWPSLIKQTGFIRSFATPLLKASKGNGKKKEVIQFTNPQSFEEWKKENNDGKGWNVKYYKGLGTSDDKEIKECFTNLNDKIIEYFWETKKEPDQKAATELLDEESEMVQNVYTPKKKDVCEEAISLAFEKTRADDRKMWVNTYNPKIYIDSFEKKISYYDFIHKELITFSVDDNLRSIPNIMDGFKPSQRKVYYGSVAENIYNKEIKVSDLQGIISMKTKYHHGEKSLTGTIISMAHNFVGSNNINLLIPGGQFGSRLCGGDDAASPRYLNTSLYMLTKKIFIEDDFEVLEHQQEDNMRIEPVYYVPIFPMILVNGSEGIGTGYSTKTKPCNPRDICQNLKRIMEDKKPKKMYPWYRHFTGTIEKIADNKYISRAKYDIIDDDTIHITDLPIGVWTDNYKAFLNELLNRKAAQKAEDRKEAKQKSVKNKGKGGSKKEARTKFLASKAKKSSTAKVAKNNNIIRYIKGYSEECTKYKVSFTIKFHPHKLKELIKEGQLEKNLKLISSLDLTNMHLFDEKGKIRKYSSYSDILTNFARVRLDFYQKRKDYLIGKWRNEIDILGWKMKFIEYVIDGKIVIFKKGKSKKKTEVIAKLVELEFPKFALGNEKELTYNYITSIGLFHLTQEEIDKLRKQLEDKKEHLAIFEAKTPVQLWNEELDEFMVEYDKWEEQIDKDYASNMEDPEAEDKIIKKRKRKSKNETKAIEL